MKNEITFKTFLEAGYFEIPRSNKNSSHSQRRGQYEMKMIQAAHTIVDNGFSQNFKDCVEMDKWFHRGDDRYKEHFKEFDAFSLCYVDQGRQKDRLSTFSGSQFSSNLWHALGFPSRRRCTMASPSPHLAADFGDVFVVIPKDKIEIAHIEQDWNLSFVKEIRGVFPDVVLNLGKLSQIFEKFHKSMDHEVVSYSKFYDRFVDYILKIDHDVNSSIEDFRQFFKTLESMILEKDSDSGDYLMPETVKSRNTILTLSIDNNSEMALEELIRMVRKENKDLFNVFENLFESFKKDLTVSRSAAGILDYHEDGEAWWTGPTLVFKSENGMHDLLRYVKAVESGEIKDSGEPDD